MNSLTNEQIAWVAGVYEGEGCVHWTAKTNATQRVSIGQKDSWLVYRLQELFGGNVRERKDINYCEWSITGPTARAFLVLIFNYLSPRRQEQIREHKVLEDFLSGTQSGVRR